MEEAEVKTETAEVVKPKPKAKVKAKPATPKPDVVSPAPIPTLGGLGLEQKQSKALQEGRITAPKEKKPAREIEVFQQLDKRDEDQIVQNLERGAVGEYVYEYCTKKGCAFQEQNRLQDCKCSNKVMDLSWSGIQEASRRMSVTIQEDMAWVNYNEKNEVTSTIGRPENSGMVVMEYPEFYRAMVRARDPVTGIERIGISRCGREIRFRNGGSMPDPFAEQKALSKATRNALRQLIPQAVIKIAIKQFLENQKGGGLLKDETLNELHMLCEQNQIELALPELREAVKQEAMGKYCIDQIKQGNLQAFQTWLGGKQKKALAQNGG